MPATVPAAAPCRFGLPGASRAALLALAVVKDGRVLDRFEGNHSAPRKSAGVAAGAIRDRPGRGRGHSNGRARNSVTPGPGCGTLSPGVAAGPDEPGLVAGQVHHVSAPIRA
jgi:hypothetical protein